MHLVDAGVDTGGVLHQVRGRPGPGDNITLYALRLAALSRDICVRGVEDALEGRLAPQDAGYAVETMVSSDDLVLSLDRLDEGRVVVEIAQDFPVCVIPTRRF